MDIDKFLNPEPPPAHLSDWPYTQVRGRLVLLGEIDARYALEVTEQKRRNVGAQGYQERHGAEPSRSEEYNRRGDAGELAFARWLGCHWKWKLGRQNPGEFDVADFYVRTSATKTLTIRPGDGPGKYVHLHELRPYDAYWVSGWLFREDVKEGWLTDYGKPERGEVYGCPVLGLRGARIPNPTHHDNRLEHVKSDPFEGQGPTP